jgi:hypothetical protein
MTRSGMTGLFGPSEFTGTWALRHRLSARRSDCKTCPLRAACLSEKADRRGIERWEHEEVIERHRARMAAHGAPMRQRRKALAEHPFGTLKCRAGHRHFLMRGLAKVRGELALMVLCYNCTRLLLARSGGQGFTARSAARSRP